jgi:F0F1-type ATP synthase membrane subunit b/b'
MFETVLDYIARTNLFNFIIFAGIIVYLFIKLDVIGGLNKGAKGVAEKIEESKTAKEESETKLQTIEDKVSHLEDEVNEIIKQSEENAKIVGEQIITDTDKSVENIKSNAIKLVENKTAILKNDIMRRASLASVEVAKDHIINELNNNYDLHNKLIDESIEEINRVEL